MIIVAMTKKINVRRGRPRAFDQDEALEVAQRLFHTHGYDTVGVSKLSEALGINPPSLYGTFGNKAELFASALDRYANTTGRFMADAFSAAPSVRSGIRAMLRSAAETYTRVPDCSGCMVMDGVHRTSDETARTACLVMRDATQRNIARYIQTEYPEDAETFAKTIMIALAGMSAAARSGATRAELQSYADLIAENLPYRKAF